MIDGFDWSGKTVAILASGPSLRKNDVVKLRGQFPLIAIKDTYVLAPWADILYGGDAAWWERNAWVPNFRGRRYTVSIKNQEWRDRAKKHGLRVLEGRNLNGLSLDPRFIHLGHHSGFQALNLAVHAGAKTIILLGFDYCAPGEKTHFFGCRPKGIAKASPYALFRHSFDPVITQLADLGVRVINCSRLTTLSCFEVADLDQALRDVKCPPLAFSKH